MRVIAHIGTYTHAHTYALISKMNVTDINFLKTDKLFTALSQDLAQRYITTREGMNAAT